VTQFTTDQDQYQVIPEIEKPSQRLPENLGLLYLRSPPAAGWSRSNRSSPGPRKPRRKNVPHANQHEAATISFSGWPGIPLAISIGAIEERAEKIIPPGVEGKFVGDALELKRSLLSLGILVLIAIFLKYIVLGILYESYLHPITILTRCPSLCLAGCLRSILTHLLFPLSGAGVISIYSAIGIFVLLGLITKNGILMVDFAIQRRREGMNSYDANPRRLLCRFRPILMTGMCAILGAMPIVLGYGADASSRKPLGLVVVGGMIFAQLITLFVTPGIYLYMENPGTLLQDPHRSGMMQSRKTRQGGGRQCLRVLSGSPPATGRFCFSSRAPSPTRRRYQSLGIPSYPTKCPCDGGELVDLEDGGALIHLVEHRHIDRVHSELGQGDKLLPEKTGPGGAG